MSDDTVLTIRVPWTPPSGIGVNAHRHWRGKHLAEQDARQFGRMATMSVPATWECPDMPVLDVVIAWEKKSRKKDSDNALGCIKHAIDGICEGLGIDDRRFITSRAFQKVDPEKMGYVDVIIRPATQDERRLAS